MNPRQPAPIRALQCIATASVLAACAAIEVASRAHRGAKDAASLAGTVAGVAATGTRLAATCAAAGLGLGAWALAEAAHLIRYRLTRCDDCGEPGARSDGRCQVCGDAARGWT